MKRTFIFICLLLLPLAAQPAQEDAVKKDLAALQGTWKIAALEVNGIQVPAQKLESSTLIIKGDQYVVMIAKEKHTVTIMLDPSKNPKELDMRFVDGANKDKVAKAIYKVEKDTFTLCRHLQPEQRRPTEFATWPDTNLFVVTWKRQ